jgi:membrane-associated phospholipid phosphatase
MSENSFDQAVDAMFTPWRQVPALNTAASAVSNLADYGFAWSVIAAAKGRRRGPARTRALRALALSGVLSFGTNAALKATIQRPRPQVDLQLGGPPVRTPTSSSFPSGHTLAAFCTAVVLADSPTETAAYLTFASAVAASRVHLGAHHATDVVGGAAIGSVVGLVGRVLLGRIARRSR